MTTYQFRAVTADGKSRNGILAADSPAAAAAQLKRQGLTPVHIGPEGQATGFRLPTFTSSARDVRFFTQELATLLTSGIPLDRALSIVSELTERPSFQAIVGDILRQVKGGRSLAEAMAAHPSAFGELQINMVRAGEAGGSLAQVFERMAEYERARDDLRGYIISASVYPVLLAAVGAASILVLLSYVVPRFATMFDDGRATIPLPTKIMLGASAFTQQYGLALLAVLAVAAAAAWWWMQTPDGRRQWHTQQLRIPLLGDVIRKAETARFARAMATLIANSVPLVESLSVASRILTNTRMARSIEQVAQGVKRGEGLSAPLTRTREFPPLAGHLLTVGEETGRLDTMFTRMADIYDADTRAAVKRFTSLFEPVLILTMGLIIGSLILSMLLAITSLNEVAL